MTPEILAALAQAKQEKRPVVLATRLPSGEQCLLPDPSAPADLNEAAARALDRDESGTVKLGDADWFLHAYNPPLRLIVVGAVHIAQALVPFAVPCGFAVTVVDPRRSFASDERFPNVEISTDWPDEALDAFAPDSRTAVVTLTHDPKLDDPALDRALKSQAFYIGALGSRRTHAARLQAPARTGPPGQRPVAHPRPGRPEYRSRHRAGNRLVDHRRDRRRSPQRAAAAETHSMKFGAVPLDEARGAIMAHSQKVGERMIRKGSLLDEAAIEALRAAGRSEVICARLEPGDVPEDIAADRLATPLLSPLIARSRAATGRVNLSGRGPGPAADRRRPDRPAEQHRRGADDWHAAGLCRGRAERPGRDDQDYPVLGPRNRAVGRRGCWSVKAPVR